VVNTVDLKKWTDEINYPGYIGDRGGFDASGLRRKADWSKMTASELALFKSPITDRGFTGHEQIDEIGLIHMNGRVYDPMLGRFISADPIIQDPTDLQSLNRYTYVRNNPLSLIDPSGSIFKGTSINPLPESSPIPEHVFFKLTGICLNNVRKAPIKRQIPEKSPRFNALQAYLSRHRDTTHAWRPA
jgi:RHS repeat-associated protein